MSSDDSDADIEASHWVSNTPSISVNPPRTETSLGADPKQLHEKRGMPTWIDPTDSEEESIPDEVELLGTDWM